MSKYKFKTIIKKRIRISTNCNEKGLVLIAALALMSILALVATLAVTTTYTNIKISSNYKTSVQAHYVAEAGVHRAIGMLNSTPDWIEGIDPDNAFSYDNRVDYGEYYGEYVVKVVEDDDPPSESVTINTTGNVSGSSSEIEVIVTPQYSKILDYAIFNCGTIILKKGETNLISGGDVFVNGNLDLVEDGDHQIQDGDVYAMGDININGSSKITGGNAFANGNIDVQSSHDPNIGGNATAGVAVDGTGTVSGNITITPDPVTDQCDGTNLAGIAITSEDIQNFRDNATFAIDDNFDFEDYDDSGGIVHIKGDFMLEEEDSRTISKNVIFIVDGEASVVEGSLTSTNGSTVTFLVPNGDFEVKGDSDEPVIIDGTLIVGTVDSDGSNPTGGNIEVGDGSTLIVNGSLIVVNGDTDVSSGGALTVNYQSPVDSNLMIPNSYAMLHWREIRN